MKTKSWILILGAVFILCAGLSVLLLLPGSKSFARVESFGKTVKTVDLRMDQTFTVVSPEGGENVVCVKDGKIGVTEASCPDHYCMHRGFCSGGADIICLPNRLVISFSGAQEVDAQTG